MLESRSKTVETVYTVSTVLRGVARLSGGLGARFVDAERAGMSSIVARRGWVSRCWGEIRFDNASAAEDESLRKTTLELSRPTESVWERLQRESTDMVTAAARQAGLKKSKAMLEKVGAEPWGLDTSDSAKLIDSAMMDPNQLALANAWSDATAGKHLLPDEVMALFDLLVHDTMLTSWHDHLLSGPLYFQTRATDTFGSTDFAEEKNQRERDDRRSSEIDRITQVTNSSIPAAR
ncbi:MULTISPECIES: hypothetical protein [unclassified Paraburkholderia]|uniref:hypothetical protein n=1 Tax=unclassified Paraburkholderia TaxID=2615204 RepID=UPI002AB326D9|nr:MULTISPECIES: hypothetical protein [unclassified Paraburkholderia]